MDLRDCRAELDIMVLVDRRLMMADATGEKGARVEVLGREDEGEEGRFMRCNVRLVDRAVRFREGLGKGFM